MNSYLKNTNTYISNKDFFVFDLSERVMKKIYEKEVFKYYIIDNNEFLEFEDETIKIDYIPVENVTDYLKFLLEIIIEK